jgi:hypothetical protein
VVPLLQFAEQYISTNKENSQIVWFLSDGWKNFLPKKTVKARGQKGVVAKAVLMQQQQEQQQEQEQEQAPGSTMTAEELEETRKRIAEKINLMDAKLSASPWVKDPFYRQKIGS